MESERIFTAIQVGFIYIRSAVNTIANNILNVLIIGSKLRYTTAPTFNNPLDIVDKQYVDNIISGSNITLSFLSSATFPLVYSTSTTLLAPLFVGVPTIIIREEVSSGVYQYRDIFPLYDSNADTLTIDAPAFNGDITIKP